MIRLCYSVRVGRVLRQAFSWKPSERFQNRNELVRAWEQAIIVAPRNRSVVLLSPPFELTLFGASFWFTTSPNPLTHLAAETDQSGFDSDVSSTENGDLPVDTSNPDPARPSRTQAPEAESRFRNVVIPTIHRYLNFDQLHDQESIEFYNWQELELDRTQTCCEDWLQDSKGAPQSRQVIRWVQRLESAKRPFAVIVQLGFVSEGHGTYDLHVSAGDATREYRLRSRESPNDCILMNIKSHMPTVVRIVDPNGKTQFKKTFVSLMAFHKGRIPNDMSFHVLHDDSDIYGRVILYDPPIAPVGRPRLQRRRSGDF